MFERFTDRARKVVVLAQEEARMLDHNCIGTEHLLLGLINEGEGVAGKALDSMGITLTGAREQVQDIIGPGQQAPSGHIPFTPQAKTVLELSLREALQLGHNYIATEHILLGIIRAGEGVAAQVLTKLGAEPQKVRSSVLKLISGYQGEGTPEESGTYAASALLDQFGRNLTAAAREGKIDPVIGRFKEMERVMQILSRRTKNNPVLIGEHGLDKGTVIEGLAQAIVRGDVTGNLYGKQLYTIDADLDTTDYHYGNIIEKRLNKILDDIQNHTDVVLFINEIHTLASADNEKSTLRRILATDLIPIIGATTQSDYYKYIETNPALEQYCQSIEVHEPSEAHAVEILKGLRDKYEAHHRVAISDDVLEVAVILARLYMRNRFLPDSAIDILDEAGARLNTSRIIEPHQVASARQEVLTIRKRKESAIDGRDYSKAAELRDEEQKLIAKLGDLERRWRAGEFGQLYEIDQNVILEVVSDVTGVPLQKLEESLYKGNPEVQPGGAQKDENQVVAPPQNYVLLGDQPIKSAEGDLLGVFESAQNIASILNSSRVSTSFVLAVDGGWGTGKSTLLHQVDSILSKVGGIKTVRFNAWTTHGDDALEGLIKSVLAEIDPRKLRRWARSISKKRHIFILGRVGIFIFARALGVTRLVDEVWGQLEVDPKTRNELKDSIHGLLNQWTENTDYGQPKKSLIVFIDDLDRCTESAVVRICEAIKLYLDAPGLIFVIACDLDRLAKGVDISGGGGKEQGLQYLEKIIQVTHRLPALDKNGVRSLVTGYAAASGVAPLVDDIIMELLSERAGRNPRQIKRIVNSFVLENHVNPEWSFPPLGGDLLICCVIIQHLYPAFYDLLAKKGDSSDPIGEFLDYVDVRRRAGDPPPVTNAWWSTVSNVFRRYGMAPPDRSTNAPLDLFSTLNGLDSRVPKIFVELADDSEFVLLLRSFGGMEARLAIRARLLNEPLMSGSIPGSDQ